MPWLIVLRAALKTDCGPAHDPAGNGGKPVKPAPIRSDHKIVLMAIRGGFGPCAVGVHCIGANLRACGDHTIHAYRVGVNEVSFSVEGDPPHRGVGPNTHESARRA